MEIIYHARLTSHPRIRARNFVYEVEALCEIGDHGPPLNNPALLPVSSSRHPMSKTLPYFPLATGRGAIPSLAHLVTEGLVQLYRPDEDCLHLYDFTDLGVSLGCDGDGRLFLASPHHEARQPVPHPYLTPFLPEPADSPRRHHDPEADFDCEAYGQALRQAFHARHPDRDYNALGVTFREDREPWGHHHLDLNVSEFYLTREERAFVSQSGHFAPETLGETTAAPHL